MTKIYVIYIGTLHDTDTFVCLKGTTFLHGTGSILSPVRERTQIKKMSIMTALFQTKPLSWIFIALTH
jgi:hypothetical protein